MTVPAAVVEHRAATQEMAERVQQVLQEAQRQPLAGVAVGLTAASDGAQTRHLGTRGVAVENLQDEQMHRRHRVENAVTPYMAHGRADAVNQFGAQKLGDIALDLLHGSEDTTGHPWPPVGMRKFVTPFCQEAASFYQISCKAGFYLDLRLSSCHSGQWSCRPR